MSDQRRRRWVDVLQMFYKCFLLLGIFIYINMEKCIEYPVAYVLRIINKVWLGSRHVKKIDVNQMLV